MRRACQSLAATARRTALHSPAAFAAAALPPVLQARGYAALPRGRSASKAERHWPPLLQPAAWACHARLASTSTGPPPPVPSSTSPAADWTLPAPAEAGEAAAHVSELASLAPYTYTPVQAFVGSLQGVVEWFHVSCDLPWWLAIVASTCALRVLIAPLIVVQMKNTARMTLARPEMERLKESQERRKAAAPDAAAAAAVDTAAYNEMLALWAKHNCNPFKAFLPILGQAPLFIGFFSAVQSMAVLPSFHSGGAFWFVDLSVADPYYALPVLSSLAFLATVELGAVDGMQGNPSAGNIKMAMRGLAVALVPLTGSFPAGVFVYWVTTNVFSLFQTAVLKVKPLRRAVGIPDTSHLAPGHVTGIAAAPTPSVLLVNKPAKKSKPVM